MATAEIPTEILFGNEAVKATLHVDKGGCVYFYDIIPSDTSPRAQGTPHFDSSATPLCEIRLSGEGNSHSKTSKALVGGADDGGKGRKTLDVVLHDEQTGITVTSHMILFDGLPVLRSSTTIRNDATKDVVVTQIPSLVIGGLTRSKEWWADFNVSYATNTWFREAQWCERSLPDVGLDDLGLYQLNQGHLAPMSTFKMSNRGTFSTQGHLPIGLLKRRDNAETWLWQVEDNVCHVFGNADAAFGALTQYRRRIRRAHPGHKHLPIIFNDYMNCLMGDPTDANILALLEPVARSGAEYFVIDAGWYADDNDWWDDVGAWEPSRKRFPMGFANLLTKIRAVGLKPGLWLEAEVIGVRCPVVADTNELPPEAYFQRDGQRVLEKNRYQLDFRHPAVIARMDGVVDRLVAAYGVAYFKFDYNIELAHGRAYLRWVSGLLDRHPGLVIENCSSGAQRMDDETNALTVVNALLSGRLDLLAPPQLELVYAGMDVYREICGDIAVVVPFWPLGFAKWHDDWLAAGLRVADDGLGEKGGGGEGRKCYLAVWHRGGQEESCELPLAALEGSKDVSTSLLYPKMPGIKLEVVGSEMLRVTIPSKIGARFFSLDWSY
ncbi:hypothetical protein PG994_004148 [Apiospora phragmitis]|uniref:alpha-galactosidase n=1 Tax=Apiospora phragmitis TaxID=2905665 RepID=A0ABR1VTM8_9PEZI